MKKLFSALIYVLVAIMTTVSFFGCTKPEEPETPPPSGKIASVDYMEFITGADSKNKTDEWGITGTDLGFPIYDSVTDEMYIFFGDSYGTGYPAGGKSSWRCNIMAISNDFDLSDGLSFNGFLTENGKEYYGTENHGNAIEIAPGLKMGSNKNEETKIPTGGIEIDGTIYMFYFSKYTWSYDAESINYGGAVKSTDNGETWERVYDLTWVNHATGNCSQYGKLAKMHGNTAENIQDLINQDINGNKNVGNIDIADHEGYFFTQIFPVDGKDGYIYIFGEAGYRISGIKVGRVLKENFENFEEYEYFGGYDENEEPIWYKGKEGLDLITYDDAAFVAGDIESLYGEHSVAYNPYLQKWVLTYLHNRGDGLCYRLAENPWGPYSDQKIIITYNWKQLPIDPVDKVPNTQIYHNAIHEKWMDENGKVMYVVISQFWDVYNSSLIKVTFE